MKSDRATIETPAFVVDESIALRNISTYQAHCDAAGLKLRPHIKTHKLIHFAKAQMDAGATGINCQKIGEAEVMAKGGIDDILITFNILGDDKLQRLRVLAQTVSKLAVTADSAEVVSRLSGAFTCADKQLNVLVECDTGAGRCGVQTPRAAAELAVIIAKEDSLVFGGLMTYPAASGEKDVVSFMTIAKELLKKNGIDCPAVSSGGSPDMWQASTDRIVTEYRIGTYIYNDRSLIARGTCSIDDCAGRVLATVVSRPTPNRAIIDAGSKVLTSDLLGLDGHGLIVGHGELQIAGLSEEHGIVLSAGEMPLNIGDRVEIIPNHVCVVSNMFDDIWLQSADGALQCVPVDARGRVT